MKGKIRGLFSLRKLLSVGDRLAALEARESKTRNRLRDQGDRLRKQRDRSQEQHDKLRVRVNSLQRRVRVVESRVEHLDSQIDLFKSSLEIPLELVEEFFEWKARTPVPEEPLVTVVVATYNRARLLTQRCIPSVLGQTYDNLELIVVGDGCTDETEEAVAEIQDPRLRFVNLSERGAYPDDPRRRWMVAGTLAMNKGLSMANGDYITHLDDDDEYPPDRLEKLVSFAAENECDFVWHPFWMENDEGDWELNEASAFKLRQVTTSSSFYRSWFKKIPWDINAHRLMEPGDWNRFRRIKYIDPVSMRYSEPLLKHYRERNQGQ